MKSWLHIESFRWKKMGWVEAYDMKMSQLATAADTSGREHEIIVATFAVKLSFFIRLM